MDLRRLGSTGLYVSPIGLGTVKFGRVTGVRYLRPAVMPTDAALEQLLSTCAELGVNLIDTAPAYGTSEERIGALMTANHWWGDRSRWVLCTKVGETYEDGQSRFDFSPEAVRQSVERSCRRLKTDVLDLVLVHSDDDDAAIMAGSDVMEALHAVKAAGLTQSVGFSGRTAAGGLRAIEQGANAVMVTYNAEYQIDLPVIREAERRGVGVLVKKALKGGHLATTPEEAAAAMRLVFSVGAGRVHSVIVGTTDPAHLRQHIASYLAGVTGADDEQPGERPHT